ncbi:MAG TPA: hypothetical protein VD999_02685 [Vitreimonas sp.]|nr:hypothetical protein [Vitreimonas sp.]
MHGIHERLWTTNAADRQFLQELGQLDKTFSSLNVDRVHIENYRLARKYIFDNGTIGRPMSGTHELDKLAEKITYKPLHDRILEMYQIVAASMK